MHQPDLVILDEPTTGVDPLSRRDFWAILTELLRDREITALVSTAYLDEASRFHHLALMHQGSVLDRGTPEQILARVPGVVVSFLSDQVEPAVARLRQRFGQVESYGDRVRLFLPGMAESEGRAAVREALGDLAPRNLELLEPELEDAFIQLLQRAPDGAAGPGSASTGDPGSSPANGLAPEGLAGSDSGPETTPGGDGVMIEACDLVRDFGAFRAVDHVRFQVRRGEIFGLLGANGAGKTTVIKMLTGLLPPTAGHGRVAGADMHSAARAIRQRIGYMFQAFSLYRDMTVLENIRLYGGIYGLHGRELRKRTHWVLDLAGIRGHEGERTGRLPMGLRQRLALGCALVHRPPVLFLDEPTSGVDPLGRRRFWELLTWLSRNQGVTILITTHYMSEAEHCDHLGLMHAGRLVADKSPEQLRQELVVEVGELLELKVDAPLKALTLLEPRFQGVSLHGNRIHLFAREGLEAAATIRALLERAGLELHDLRRRTPGMEDIFVYRMRALERQAA